MKWKPIDSAPKDGSFVIGCISPPTKGEGFSGGWMYEYEQYMGPMTVSWRGFHPNAPGKKCWRNADGKPVSPTHWIPMLPTPKKERL